jgi:hypothetical protein
MALLVPNVGEVIVLNNFLNKTAPENQTLKLFVSNTTPAEGDTHTTYTEAAGGGYAAKSLTGASWTVTSGDPTFAAAAQQTFAFTGALTTNLVIYGYYVVQTTAGTLMWAERAAATFQPANNGDEYRVTPRIEAA